MQNLKPIMFQRLKAPNDVNGNPRRVYTLLDVRGNILEAIDEGYQGEPKLCRSLVQLPEYDVSPTTYKSILKQFAK